MEASASAAAALPVHFSLPSAERGRPLSGPGDGSFHGEVDFEFLRERSGNNPFSHPFSHSLLFKMSGCPIVCTQKIEVFFSTILGCENSDFRVHLLRALLDLSNFHVKGFIACCPAMTATLESVSKICIDL